MNESPIRNSMGDIGCPKCLISLKKAKVPFKMFGEFVGNFESYVCPMCNYSALTENGYDEAIVQARQLAITQDIPEIKEIQFRIHHNITGINNQRLEEIYENKQEIQSISVGNNILGKESQLTNFEEDMLQINLFTKKTRS